MTDELLPKPSLPATEAAGNIGQAQTDLPLPEKDLPLPENEITAGKIHQTESPDLASQGVPFEPDQIPPASQQGPTLQNPVVKNEKPAGKSPILKYVLLGVIFVIIIAFIGGGAYYLGMNKSNSSNDETMTTRTNSPSPTISTTEDSQTYAGDGFSFSIPKGYQIQKETPDITFWKSDFITGEFIYSSMILYTQNTSFSNLTNGNKFTLYSQGSESYTPISVSVEGIEDYKKINLDGESAVRYTVNCGVDCYFHILQFEANGKYYRLVFNGAGGGLITKFENLLSSFKFADSTSQLNNSNSNTSPAPTSGMAAWKKYNDVNYPFNVEYPSYWNLRTTYGKSVNNINNQRIAGIDISSDISYGSTVIINIIDPKGIEFNEWVEKYSGFGQSASQKPNYSYKGTPAYMNESEGSGGRKNTIIVYPYKDKVVYLEWHNFENDQETADQIIDSLKFN